MNWNWPYTTGNTQSGVAAFSDVGIGGILTERKGLVLAAFSGGPKGLSSSAVERRDGEEFQPRKDGAKQFLMKITLIAISPLALCEDSH